MIPNNICYNINDNFMLARCLKNCSVGGSMFCSVHAEKKNVYRQFATNELRFPQTNFVCRVWNCHFQTFLQLRETSHLVAENEFRLSYTQVKFKLQQLKFVSHNWNPSFRCINRTLIVQSYFMVKLLLYKQITNLSFNTRTEIDTEVRWVQSIRRRTDIGRKIISIKNNNNNDRNSLRCIIYIKYIF